jgi:GntR family transcriptional regulator
METLIRTSKLPLYQQIYEILRKEITGGLWKAGELFPPESELIRKYQVSSITIRQALDMLQNDGLITRHRGKGTFIALQSLEKNLTRIISFTEDMRQRGSVPGTTVLSLSLIPAPIEIAKRLDIEPGEDLARIQRLRLADGEPVSLEDSYLVNKYCKGVLDYDLVGKSLRQILENDFNIYEVHAKETIRAILAPAPMAKLLLVNHNAALLFVERVSFSQFGIPVEYLHIYYRGDRYTLYNELQA